MPGVLSNGFRDLPWVFSPAAQPIQHNTVGGVRRILLVDDDDDVRRLMRSFLEPEGYQVYSCGDSLRALQIFCGRGNIDLLIVDLHMPVISGLSLAEEIAALRPSLPIAIASGEGITTELWETIQARHWHFLSKPFQVPEALELIRSTFEAEPADFVQAR